MKKLLLSLILLLSMAGAKADEGMWTLYNLPQPIYEQMVAEGFSLPYDQLYQSQNAVKNSVVNFSGFCSGVVVSPDGLVFTNHHCGFDAIRKHSTVEHDYMRDGFVSNSYAEELPNEGMFVAFMRAQEDITDAFNKANFYSLSEEAQVAFADSLQQALTNKVREKDSTLYVEVKPFYEGNRFYATTYQMYTDVRLVFAVPKSMGKFGGETDNWMWPRQTCDFSVFRIYADPKTNGPAEYSKDNVPYKPESWAPVSLQGYKEGDFAMTLGYPGSTERYLSSYGIQLMRDASNAPRAQVRGVKQEVMWRHMLADQAVRIKYDSKYAQSANYWKNSIGMNKCIDSIGIVGQKELYERQIKAWMDSTKFQTKLDLDLLKEKYQGMSKPMKALTLYAETFRRNNELCSRALNACNGRMPLTEDSDDKHHYIIFDDDQRTWDYDTDREIFGAMLKNYREQADPEYLPDFYKTIDKKYKGDCQAFADHLYATSILMKSNKKIDTNSKKYLKDEAVNMGVELLSIMMAIYNQVSDNSTVIEEQERYLCDAKMQMEQQKPLYSDANFTMRLSYGQVKAVDIAGKSAGFYTTAESIVEKMKKADENIEYFAEPIMHELFTQPDYGKYADKTTGKMQLCFLTNNDITGGNSGSPMFNGKGELIGLAFDGNWDSLASDINFDKVLARTIGVDIRYVLYMMDKWGHADRLLKEINAK